jgi:hypothetical protein
MKQSCKGFILVATLLMLLVFALLIVTGLQQTALYLKTITRQEEAHQKFYGMEYIAEHLAKYGHLERNSKCISRNQLSDKELIQVLNNSECVLPAGESRFKYFIEDLGDFPCLVIAKGELNYMSHHYRLTIIHENTDEPNTLLLQLRYFTISGVSECKSMVERVKEEVSTWRYFSQDLRKTPITSLKMSRSLSA